MEQGNLFKQGSLRGAPSLLLWASEAPNRSLPVAQGSVAHSQGLFLKAREGTKMSLTAECQTPCEIPEAFL